MACLIKFKSVDYWWEQFHFRSLDKEFILLKGIDELLKITCNKYFFVQNYL